MHSNISEHFAILFPNFDTFWAEFREYLQKMENSLRFAEHVCQILHVLHVNQNFLNVVRLRKHVIFTCKEMLRMK